MLENIEIFLMIVETNSLSLTADRLFMSQSTVSTKLNNLEKELGVKLIERQRGKREISLTQKGRDFIFYAQNIMNSYESLEYWKRSPKRIELSVSGPISVNTYVLREFYNHLAEESENIMIKLSSHWNETIYTLMETKELDVGISSKYYESKTLLSKLLYKEKMVLITDSKSKYKNISNIEDLDVEDEIFIDWGIEFLQWHERNWSRLSQPKIITDTPSMMKYFLNIEDSWAIVPISVVDALEEETNLVVIEDLTRDLIRSVYLVKQRNMSNEKKGAVLEFKESLIKYLSKIDYIDLKYNRRKL